MKANELMVGDFLRYKQDFPNTHLQEKIVKVCGIRGRVDVITIDDGNYHESVHPDWLEPIPITAEILEKNGMKVFEHRNPWQEAKNLIKKWYSKDGRFYVSYYRVGDMFTYTVGNNVSRICGIKNVHQLQNALRLCGIEKEIII